MAEGWARHLRGDVLQPYSAGIEAHGLNPYAAAVMQEAGVDITGQQSQVLSELDDVNIDVVVTVCSHAHETCPVFPRDAKIVHHGFDDPPGLARDLTDEEEILTIYRRVRDEIRAYVKTLPGSLNTA